MNRRFRTLAAAAVFSAMIAASAGCASARNGLGTTSGVCFSAIPVGKSALGKPVTPPTAPGSTKKPRPVMPVFFGVRSASAKDIEKFESKHQHENLVAELKKRNNGQIKSLCLVAFRGLFDPTSVKDLLGPVPPPDDRIFAVAVVAEPKNELLATFIRSKVPISFSHYVVGG
jgi:hypothetical protein